MKRDDSKKQMGFYGENNSDTSNIQLSLNNSYVKKLINNSLEFNLIKNIDHIFNNKMNLYICNMKNLILKEKIDDK